MSPCRATLFTVVAAMCLGAPATQAALIGTNVSAKPLTAERIARLPSATQAAWNDYLRRSDAQREADQQALMRELGAQNLAESIEPPGGRGVGSIPLWRPGQWYAGDEALRIAGIIVSFQTPSGGWSKNLDLSRHVRRPGEGFAPDNSSRYVSADDNDGLKEVHWSYVGTIDNGATIGELRFLARVIHARSEGRSEDLQLAFSKGIAYLLAAQYPNGGWPQVWPLQGGYHDAITYNDGAMVGVLNLLRDAAAGRGDFDFVPQVERERCAEAVRRGVACLLDTQVLVQGKRTVWCQQHDALTLEPCAARNYEMPSLCSAESGALAAFLMEVPQPDSNVVAAVEGAVAWFKAAALQDVAFRNAGDQGRLLVTVPGAGPLWSRYYEVGSDRPIFGERDKTIHDDVADISRERRQGYAWYSDEPAQILRKYPKWRESLGVRTASPEN